VESCRRTAAKIRPTVGTRHDDRRSESNTSLCAWSDLTGQFDQSTVSCVSYSHALCTGRHDRAPRSLARDDPTPREAP
jgi:hypothetical protein